MADEYELKQVKVRLCLKEAEPLYSDQPITDSQKAVEVMAKAMAELDREYCAVICCTDAQKRVISFETISIGDLSQTQIPIQNLFKSAILQNAGSLIALHNHPSGSLTPSQADLSVTKRMVEAGRLIGIPVTDHIIVAGGTGLHTSIRSTNPELFSFVAEQSPRFVAEEKPKKRVSVKKQIAEKQAAIAPKEKSAKKKGLER
ncbi:MAG: JAB domain-containing protein [Lachnospiraceae bacterium]|jgi:DNA repair protein RadC|nr:JAB domain-containing protein [Lachnospiraceae bacterium]